jgi:hypothetical protein
LTVRLEASDLETVVSAARQPDSDPICEKPTVSWAAIAGGATSAVVSARLTKIFFKAMRRFLFFVEVGPFWYLDTVFGIDRPEGHRVIGQISTLVILYYF